MRIIAESAFNHQGKIEYLKDLAIASKEAHADFFTVQVMDVDAFCIPTYEKYELYRRTAFTTTQWIK